MGIPIVIGQYAFKTKTAAKQYCKELMGRYELYQPIIGADDAFLRALLSSHHDADNRMGVGVDYFTKEPHPLYQASVCFVAHQYDGKYREFSYIRAIDGYTTKQLITHIMRNTVKDQIDDFRQHCVNSGVRCWFTGELLADSNFHIDHEPPTTFNALVAKWLDVNKLTFNDVEIGSPDVNFSGRTMGNETQRTSWIHFHLNNAKLRIISKRANLTHAKAEARTGVKAPISTITIDAYNQDTSTLYGFTMDRDGNVTWVC